MRLLPSLTLSVLAIGLIQAPASAGLTPYSQQFGALPDTLPAANFGGSGIPNNAIAYSTFQEGAARITLGLSATPRYSNLVIGNDGEGTYYAPPGESQSGTPDGAVWNFGYYINIAGVSNTSNYVFELDYYLDATQSDHGTLRIYPSSSLEQGSQNLSFNYLHTYIPLVVSPPSGTFDPDAEGLYGFRLTAFRRSGFLGLTLTEIGESVSILVNVGDVGPGEVNPVPEPSTFVAGILGVGLLAGAQYRRNRKKASA